MDRSRVNHPREDIVMQLSQMGSIVRSWVVETWHLEVGRLPESRGDVTVRSQENGHTVFMREEDMKTDVRKTQDEEMWP